MKFTLKEFLKIIIVFFITNLVSAQDFEGIIRYGMTFQPVKGLNHTKERLTEIEKIKNKKENDSAIVAYKKGGDFLKFIQTPKVINIYDSNTQLIYTLEENDKYIITKKLTTKSKPNRKKPLITKMDTIVEINNLKCKVLHFDYEYYEVTAYYNDDPKYKEMGKPFFYESLIDFDIRNSLLENVLIVRYIQKYDDVNTVLDLLDIREIKIDTSIFNIPKFKKSRKYDYDEQEKIQVYKIADKNYQFPILNK